MSFRLRSSHRNVPPSAKLHPQPWRRLLLGLCGGSRDRTCVGSWYVLPSPSVYLFELLNTHIPPPKVMLCCSARDIVVLPYNTTPAHVKYEHPPVAFFFSLDLYVKWREGPLSVLAISTLTLKTLAFFREFMVCLLSMCPKAQGLHHCSLSCPLSKSPLKFH